MAHRIKVIGIGPGSPEYLLPVAKAEVALCQAVLGSPRALALFQLEGKETRFLDGDLIGGLNFLLTKRIEGPVGVLVSGDPGFYSFLAFLRSHLSAEELEVIPGISSLQIAFARLALPWQNANLLSLHGRPSGDLTFYLEKGEPLGLLVDSRMKGKDLAKKLQAHGDFKVHLCSNLTYPNEKIITLSISDLEKEIDLGNTVVVIEPNEKR